MSVLTASNLTLGFSGPNILDGVELSIQPGERVCLVGRNGEGKSSLMKVLAKQIQPDSGTVDYGHHTHVAYLTQHVPEDITGTIRSVVSLGFGNTAELLERYELLSSTLTEGSAGDLKELETIQQELDERDGWTMPQKVDALLTQLDLDADALFSSLSGGMKRRVLLAQAVAAKPGLLMLDEPTNHLDIQSIDWLENFLKGFSGALLFVTHDRMFLRAVATRILDLDRGKLTSWPGNFDLYQERKADTLDAESKEWDRFDKKLAEEEVWIRQGIKARRTRNEGRVRALEKLRKERKARRDRVGQANIKVQSAERSGKDVIEIENLTYGWDSVPLVKNFSCTIQRSDRIGILGPNGAGKTTLVRLLLGQLKPESGSVYHGTNLEVAYFDQLRAQLDENASVQDNLCDGHDTVQIGGQSRHVISYLKDFLFSPERARSPLRTLSGGERNRLLLAKLFTQPANVLVLDEPTNDLDTETLELLETLLLGFDGTLLLVSHDREFLNNVVTSTIAFDDDGGVRNYVGGYDDWVRQRPPTQAMLNAAAPPEKKAKAERPKKDKPKKLSFKEKKELETLPGEIEALESEQSELHAKIANPDFYKTEGGEAFAAVNARLEEIEGILSERYERWEALEAIADES